VGDAANGIPRYLVTEALAPLSEVAVPTTKPESTVTVGPAALVGAVWHIEKKTERKTTRSKREMVAIRGFGEWTARQELFKRRQLQARQQRQPQAFKNLDRD